MGDPNNVLPNTLLVLVHLHLLSYPLSDASRYNEYLFDPTHTGIRERGKAMEDICYFLVGEIEGRKGYAKSILPTYPCLLPADTTAFRISLSKYLESLRHGTLHSTQSANKAKLLVDKQTAAPVPKSEVAWWWRDVVVRKSLLEECCGERFERLILALSTHTLLKHCALGSRVSLSPEQLDASRQIEAFHGLPRTYAELLNAAQAARRSWESTASQLLGREHDLALLREHLSKPATLFNSKYDDLPTDRLVAQCEARHHDLLQTQWHGDPGRNALHYLVEITGLQHDPASTISSEICNYQITARRHDAKTAPDSLPSPPLPIAAAHHPTNLHALSKPLFPAATKASPTSSSSQNHDSSMRHPQTATRGVSERLSLEKRTQLALQDALARAETARGVLQLRLRGQATLGTGRRERKGAVSDLKLWEASPRRNVDFQITPPSRRPESSSSHPQLPIHPLLEERIAQIRSSIVPAYPVVPETPAPVDLPAASSSTGIPPSRLRQPSGKGKYQAPHNGPHASSPGLEPFAPSHFANSRGAPRPDRPTFMVGGKPVLPPASLRTDTRRASAARARRSTILLRRGVLDDEVDKILESMDDYRDEDEHADAALKQRGGTIGVPLSAVKKTMARPSFDIEDAMDTLPKLEFNGHDDYDFHSKGHAGSSREDAKMTDELSENLHCRKGPGSDDEYYEGQSVTLKEILIKAGTGGLVHYSLLEDEGEPEDLLEWD